MVIASRALKLQQGGKESEIAIRVFAPRKAKDAWSCQYEIDWPEGTQRTESWGIDSVQSLLVALQMIGSDIYTSSYHKSGNLMFEGLRRGYGFPVPKSLEDRLEGDDALYSA